MVFTHAFNQSLRMRLALLLLLAFTPVLALIVYRAYQEQNHRLAEIDASELRMARQIAGGFNQSIARVSESMRLLAEIPVVRGLKVGACNDLFARLVTSDTRAENFLVARLDGEVVCSGVPLRAPINVAGRPSFMRAAKTGQLAMSDLRLGAISQQRGMGMALPVRDEQGQTIALIGTLLSAEWLSEIALETMLPEGGALTVIDRAGTVVLRQPNGDRWIGQTFAGDPLIAAALDNREHFEGRSFDGVHRRYAVARVAGVPEPAALFVATGIDSQVALQPIRAALYRDLTLVLAVAALASFVAWIGARRSVLQPVNSLLAATRNLGEGNLDTRAQLRQGPDELRKLGAAFDEMAAALQRHDEESQASRKQLAEKESLLSNVLETLPVGVWVIGADGKIITGNREGREIWGGIKYVGIDDYDQYRAWWRGSGKRVQAREWGVARALLTGEASGNEIIDIEAFDGTRKTIAHWATPIRDERDAIVGAISINQNITERIRAESELAASEQRFRTLFDSTPDGILVEQSDGIIVDANLAAARMYGYERDELIGMHPSQHVDESELPRLAKDIQAVQLGKPYMGEWRLVRKDRSTFDGEVYVSLMPNGNMIVILRDITERKQAEAARRSLEEQLRQSQKMESLGTLAGGIAHDFNNILGAIIGNVELARQDAGDNEALQTSLAEIRKASHRARDLVRQILIFSRQQPQERSVVQLAEVVTESVRLLRATLPAGVELLVHCAADVPNVLADRTQVGQALMNLCTNAWHAMEGHTGRIDIDLRHVIKESGTNPPQGNYACLSVKDSGRGMDAKTIERIFDPFFTTKGPGGTGLGLAVVDGVMKNHDGFVCVSSELGSGAKFDLYFPVATIAAVAAADTSADLPCGKRQRILYLDDEESLVLLAERFLGRLGYEVEGCVRVEEALDRFRADPGRFDLLVTDLNMPTASGLDVAREILGVRPDLPIALASGYVTDVLCEQAKALGIRDVIYKPNTVEDMAQAIHRLLRELA